mgnify:CR=1 FL=1
MPSPDQWRVSSSRNPHAGKQGFQLLEPVTITMTLKAHSQMPLPNGTQSTKETDPGKVFSFSVCKGDTFGPPDDECPYITRSSAAFTLAEIVGSQTVLLKFAPGLTLSPEHPGLDSEKGLLNLAQGPAEFTIMATDVRASLLVELVSGVVPDRFAQG